MRGFYNIIDKLSIYIKKFIVYITYTNDIINGIFITLLFLLFLVSISNFFKLSVSSLYYGIKYKNFNYIKIGFILNLCILFFLGYICLPLKTSDLVYDYANGNAVSDTVLDFYNRYPDVSLYCSSAYKDKNIEAKEKEETWFDYVCKRPYNFSNNYIENMITLGYDIERRSCQNCIEGTCENENCIGVTPLMLACDYGNQSVCEILIENGVDINAVDSKGNCAAVYLLNEPLINNKGYTVNLYILHRMVLTENGFTKENEENILNHLDSGEIVSQFFEYVTHESLLETDKQYIREITNGYNLDTLTCLYFDILESLQDETLDKSSLYFYFDSINSDRLSVQVMSKDINSLKIYFEDYDITEQDLYVRPYIDLTRATDNETTWFEYLVVDANNTKDRMEKIKLFLDYGYDIERRSCYFFDFREHEEHKLYHGSFDKEICNLTPLMQVCKKGDFDVVKCLVENGADINAINTIKGDTYVIDYVFKDITTEEDLIDSLYRMDIVYYLYNQGLSVESKEHLLENIQEQSLELLLCLYNEDLKNILVGSEHAKERQEISILLDNLTLEERLQYLYYFISIEDFSGITIKDLKESIINFECSDEIEALMKTKLFSDLVGI